MGMEERYHSWNTQVDWIEEQGHCSGHGMAEKKVQDGSVHGALQGVVLQENYLEPYHATEQGVDCRRM